jgi:PAS domain S-box-containing protein
LLNDFMTQVNPLDAARDSQSTAHRGWRAASLLLAGISIILFVFVLVSNLQKPRISLLLLIAMAVLFLVFVLLLAAVFFQLRRSQSYAASLVEATKDQFQEMANHIQEIFWMIDAGNKKVLYVNQAFETITGHSRQGLFDNLLSCEKIIHPEDRSHVMAQFEEAVRSGHFNERFRIIRGQNEVRWLAVQGFPVQDETGKILRLVGTAQEITAQKNAEDQVAENLAVAHSAWAETDALHKATLALTQHLRMDFVLDALLRSLEELVPYSCARILVSEGGPHILTLGERMSPEAENPASKYPLTLNVEESPFLQGVVAAQKSILVSDTAEEKEWNNLKGHSHLRSWLSVPLIASEQYLGLLSIGHSEPNLYTGQHLRRAEMLAIPAAAAIQNARLYQTAQIYGAELEKRLADLKQAQAALAQSEGERRTSEEKFQRVFRASPIAFSITTLKDGRFVDVNAAFERRYGYCRADVIGRTVGELRIWEDPGDRVLMLSQLQRCGPVRNIITRIRTKSGEVKITACSADKIQFEGEACILAVSEDLPNADPLN